MQESMHLSAWPDTSGLKHSSISIVSEITRSITPSAGREKTKWSPWKKGNMHTPISVQKENKTEKNYSWRLYIVHRYIGFYRSEKHNFVWVKKWEFSLEKKPTSIILNQLASLMLVFLHKKKKSICFSIGVNTYQNQPSHLRTGFIMSRADFREKLRQVKKIIWGKA